MNRDLSLFFEKFKVPEKIKHLILKIFTEEEIILLNHLAEREDTMENVKAKFFHYPSSILKSIYNKGYLSRRQKKEEVYYKSIPFEDLLKIYIKRSPAFQRLTDSEKAVCQECVTDWSLKEMTESKVPVYRIVPIEITIPDKRQLIPYYQARSYIQGATDLSLVDCLCRATFQNCDKPIKVCLALNKKAEFFLNNETGKRIGVQDGLEILEIAEKNGLVHSINNTENPDYLCNCCACCCVFIQALKKHGIFTSIGKSGFIAELEDEMCNLCGLCIEMCLFEAISIANESIKIDKDRCFGCGLCSYHCPQSAIRLILPGDRT